MPIKISPKYDLEELQKATFQNDWKTALIIFKDHLFGWFLEHARNIDEKGGYTKAALGFIWIEGLAFWYLEPEDIPKKRDGSVASKKLFKKMFNIIFGTNINDGEYVERIYKLGRCQLTHQMMIRKDLIVTRKYPNSFTVIKKGKNANHPDPVILNPDAFIDKIYSFVNDWLNKILIEEEPHFSKFKSMIRREFGFLETIFVEKGEPIITSF